MYFARMTKRPSATSASQVPDESKGSLVLVRVKSLLKSRESSAVSVHTVHKSFDGDFTLAETQGVLDALVELGTLVCPVEGTYALPSGTEWTRQDTGKLRRRMTTLLKKDPGTGWTSTMLHERLNTKGNSAPLNRIQSLLSHMHNGGLLHRPVRGVYLWVEGRGDKEVAKRTREVQSHWANDPQLNWERVAASLMAQDASMAWSAIALREALWERGVECGKTSMFAFLKERLEQGLIKKEPGRRGGYYWVLNMDLHCRFAVPKVIRQREPSGRSRRAPVRRAQTEVPGTSASEGESPAPEGNGEGYKRTTTDASGSNEAPKGKKYFKPGVHVPKHLQKGS
jgi:hypothetical protein